jgi:hypothetical protein
MVITSKDPADSLSEKSTDLVFTGKIYIYYEKAMSTEQIAALEKLFTSKKLFPQFRSLDYASVRWLQSIATPPSPIPSMAASPH